MYFDRAKGNRSIEFALMILQRRFTSSTHAICRSLERRKARLEELLTLPEDERMDIEARVEHLMIARPPGKSLHIHHIPDLCPIKGRPYTYG